MSDPIKGKEDFLALLRATAAKDPRAAEAAKYEMAAAIAGVIREGIVSGDIVRGLYQVDDSGGDAKYQIDLLVPGTEHLHRGYTIPSTGRIPNRHVEGDFFYIPVFKIGSSIDWNLDFAKDANWMMVQRALTILKASFDKKINDDGWHTILAAGADRNIMVYDADANAGQFTKRLISLMKTTFARNAGGNSSSVGQKMLTDVALSLEGQEDIRNWGIDQISESTRTDIYNASDNSDVLLRVFGVNLHPLYELGENQEYQNFFTSQLAGSLQGSDLELVVGMDTRPASNTFIMPIRDEVEIFPDLTMHRAGMEGYYGTARLGFGICDSRDVILSSF